MLSVDGCNYFILNLHHLLQVLLNIHNEEVVIGIALTEESLHRRNISHFGPTTLRSTLCYGMLRWLVFQDPRGLANVSFFMKSLMFWKEGRAA